MAAGCEPRNAHHAASHAHKSQGDGPPPPPMPLCFTLITAPVAACENGVFASFHGQYKRCTSRRASYADRTETSMRTSPVDGGESWVRASPSQTALHFLLPGAGGRVDAHHCSVPVISCEGRPWRCAIHIQGQAAVDRTQHHGKSWRRGLCLSEATWSDSRASFPVSRLGNDA